MNKPQLRKQPRGVMRYTLNFNTPQAKPPLYASSGFRSGLNVFNLLSGQWFTNTADALRNYASWTYVATSTISTDIAALEIKATRKGGVELESHWLLDLLARPSALYSGNAFRQLAQLYLDLAGEFFIFMERSESGVSRGRIAALHLLRPDRVMLVPDPNRGIRGYLYTPEAGQVAAFMPEEIIHARYVNPQDDYRGAIPMAGMGAYRDLSGLLATFASNFIRGDARPSGLLSTEQELTDDVADMLRAKWEERYGELSNKGRVAVLWAGTKYQNIQGPLKDIEIKNLDDSSRDHVFACYNFPKFKAGIIEGDGRANAQSSVLVYETSCLYGRRNLWNEDVLAALVRASGEDVLLEMASPISQDVQAEREAALKELQAGSITVKQYHMRLGNPEAQDAPEVYLLPNTHRVVDALEPEPPSDQQQTPPTPARNAQEPPEPLPSTNTAPNPPKRLTPAQASLQSRLRGIFAAEYAERRDGNYSRQTAIRRYGDVLGDTYQAAALVIEIESQVAQRGLLEVYETLKSSKGAGAMAVYLTQIEGLGGAS